MLGRRDQPLPIREVRDLLGLVRGMYRAEQASERRSPTRLARLKKIGEGLTSALELAAAGKPGDVGARAAWVHAEEAVAALGREISTLEPLEPVVREASNAIRRETVATTVQPLRRGPMR